MSSHPPFESTTEESRGGLLREVTIGILTALPVEVAAMACLIDDLRPFEVPDDPNNYRVGSLPSRDLRSRHHVALALLPRDGTRSAAMMSTNLLRTFPYVRCVVMVGIAGGIPRPRTPPKHVRLGDIAVATEGIVDYGHVRQVDGVRQVRRSDGLISGRLLQAANELQISELNGQRPWERWLDPEQCTSAGDYPRPEDETDQLFVRGIAVPHPDREASHHPHNKPKIHYGAIASADVLMRDELARDELAKEFGELVAVEMEGSGVATSTAGHDVSWFMVRGIVDYCEPMGKNDVWHRNASFAAAAYVRSLLEVCRPFPVVPLLNDKDQTDIQMMIERVPPLNVREIWDATFDYLLEPPTDVTASLGRTFKYLLTANADADGLPPIVAFMDAVASKVDDSDLAVGLHRWAERQAAITGVAAAFERWRSRRTVDDNQDRASLSLLVQIAVDEIDGVSCWVSSWIQEREGRWRPRPGPWEPRHMSLNDAEDYVVSLIERAEHAWRNSSSSAVIEFALPGRLLNLPVEWWRSASEEGPLCVDYTIVVRSLERMYRIDRLRMWGMRWNALLAGSMQPGVYWGAGALTKEQLVLWGSQLRNNLELTTVVLSTPPNLWPGRDELGMALTAGVPAIVWDRSEILSESHRAALEQLIQGDLRELPARVKDMRAHAASLPQDQRHGSVGGFVVLLWDNPRHLVEPWEAGVEPHKR